jgi:hypothetical protein
MTMFCCALADYHWVEHISSTRAIARTSMIACENPRVHFRNFAKSHLVVVSVDLNLHSDQVSLPLTAWTPLSQSS